MQPTPVLLPGKSHGRRRLVGCSPWGRGESDTTEQLHFHFSLSCIGEGNGNPLQCSCLENPRDSRAWWAAIYGVAQSWTRLKRLSSSSSSTGSNWGWFAIIPSSPDPGDIWHYLETILIVTTVSGVDAPSIKLVEARGQAVHPTMHRTAASAKKSLSSHVNHAKVKKSDRHLPTS